MSDIRESAPVAPGVARIRDSLRLSIFSGLAWAGMAGLTQNWVTPFALELKATAFQIGLLTSVPNIAMALSQLFAPDLTQRIGSRKGITLAGIYMDALLWLPLAFVPFLPFTSNNQAVWFMLVFFAIRGVGGSLGGPAWSSMMAALVPKKVRGRFFSWRGMLVNGTVLIFSFIAMGIMELFKTRDKLTGFSILFGSAAAFRLCSAFFFSRQYEPPMPRERKENNIWRTVLHIGGSHFGRFTILMCVFTFVGTLAMPFYAVYLYRDLKFDFLPYIIVTTTPMVFVAVFQPFWGRRADVAGNAKIMKLALAFAPLGPIMWIFSPNLGYLVCLQIIGAFFNAGLNLALGNYIMDEAKPDEVTRNMAIFNAFMGIAGFMGALLGGVLATQLPPLLGYRLKTLFLLQGLLLACVVVFGIRLIKEVRKVERVGTVNLLLGKYHDGKEQENGRSNYGFRIMPELTDEELLARDDDDDPNAE